MAITLVGTVQIGNNANGNDITLTFDGTPLEDDVVVVVGGNRGDSAGSMGIATAGYTTHVEHDGTPGVGVYSKVLGATPDSQVVGEGSGSNTDAGAYASFVLRGVDTTQILDVAIVEVGPTSTFQPDPGAITTVTDGAWVIAAVAEDFNRLVDVFPTDYVNQEWTGRSDNNRYGLAVCSREVATAGSEDPSTFELFADQAQTCYVLTIAIRPAGGAGGTPATATPAVTGLSFAISQATAASPGSTAPDPISTSVATPAVGVAGSAVAEPDAITPSLSIETPTPAGAAVVTPDAVSTSFTIPTPTAVEGEDAGTAQPDPITPTLTLPGPTPAGGAVATPDAIAVTVVMPAPDAKGATAVTPDEIAVAVSFGQVTVEGGAVVTPDTIALTLTLPQATADGQVPAELIAQVINSTFGRQVVTGKAIRQAITGDTFIS